MKKKSILTFGLALAMIINQQITGLASEWIQDDIGWKYVFDNGTVTANKITQIDQYRYIFGADGYMLKGWQMFEGRWYYLDSEGRISTGWLYLDGKWYYMTDYGYMMTGFVTVGDKNFYLNPDGSLRTGSFEIEETWYETDGNGAIIKNKMKNTKGNQSTLLSSDDGSIWRYNQMESSWDYLPGKEESARLMLDKLFEDFKNSGDESTFESDARKNLKGLITDEDIELFIEEMEADYMFNYDEKPDEYVDEGIWD